MKLNAWLAASPLKDHEFAGKIGVSRVTLFRLKKGLRPPKRDVMTKINEVTEGAVTPNDFFDLPETERAVS